MPPTVDEVRHDIAALHRFIDSIASECERIDEYPSYVGPSKKFFDYIHLLSKATKSYLSSFLAALDPALATTDPDDFYSQTQVVRTLRTTWFRLHELVKPALDADTLHVPYALVDALTARLRQIQNFQAVEFAVLHTTQLNYFQIGANYVRRLASDIASIVPGAPSFPLNLGIIALPYSQSSAIFLNTALAHEMGHFAFQERGEATLFAPRLVGAIQASTSTPLSPRNMAWCKDRVLTWCEELYCDLFALWLIGPSFSFAFVELFAYTRLAPKPSPPGPALPPIASEATFGDSHPAPAFRLGEHVRFLKKPPLGWWDEVSAGSSHYISLLADAEALPQTAFGFDSHYGLNLEAVALSAFFAVVSEVSVAVTRAFTGVSSQSDLFHEQRDSIQEYLSFGVVPSRLVSEDGITLPSSVALVNAAYLFYLEHLDDLIGKIQGASTDCLGCRAIWSERVEMWTSKALEDVGSS